MINIRYKPLNLLIHTFLLLIYPLQASSLPRQVDDILRYEEQKKIYEAQTKELQPAKTKSKDLSISLTYNKPKDPTLAKQSTHEDLKRRAKRMLDSLYIKDGW